MRYRGYRLRQIKYVMDTDYRGYRQIKDTGDTGGIQGIQGIQAVQEIQGIQAKQGYSRNTGDTVGTGSGKSRM